MGRAAKSRNREKRAQAKRSRKAANQAQYQAWAKAGENTKSFRARKRIKRTKYNVNQGEHFHYCGNIACNKCFERTETGIIKRRNKIAA